MDGSADTAELYANTGIYQLPLLEKPNDFSDFIQMIPRKNSVEEYIKETIANGNLKMKSGCSLMVKLIDNQLEVSPFMRRSI